MSTPQMKAYGPSTFAFLQITYITLLGTDVKSNLNK